MTFKFAGLCLLVAATLAPAVLDAADYVNRKGGEKRVAGTITEATKTELTIKPSTGEPVTVPANDVASIEWNDAPSEMKLGRSDEANGRFASALQRFAKALEDGRPSNELVKTDLDFLIARATARAAFADPQSRDDAVAKLTSFMKANPDSFRWYDAQQLLGQVQLAREDFAAARTAFETLSQAPWNDVKLSASVNLGRVLMAENKLDEAAQAFDTAIAAAGSTPGEVSRKYEAMVGKARSLVAQNKQAEALTVLNEVVDQASPEESALLAEAYVLQGACKRRTSRKRPCWRTCMSMFCSPASRPRMPRRCTIWRNSGKSCSIRTVRRKRRTSWKATIPTANGPRN